MLRHVHVQNAWYLDLYNLYIINDLYTHISIYPLLVLWLLGESDFQWQHGGVVLSLLSPRQCGAERCSAALKAKDAWFCEKVSLKHKNPPFLI